MSVHVVNIFYLLVGDVYHVKNEGCFLEVFIMGLFNQTLSMYVQHFIRFFEEKN